MKLLSFLVAALLASCAVDTPSPSAPPQGTTPPASEAPTDWNAWAKWVEAQQPTDDGRGHGPDVGSDEWAYVIDRRLGITDSQGHGPDLKSDEWRRAVEFKLGR